MVCSTTYNVELIDEIRPRIENVTHHLAAAAMSGTPLNIDEIVALVALLDRTQRLLAQVLEVTA